MVVKINVSKCPQDHKCPAVSVCPVGALVQEENNAPTVLTDICIGCGKCSDFCPKKALTLDGWTR